MCVNCEVTVLYPRDSVSVAISLRSKVHCENDQGKDMAQVMINKSVKAKECMVLAPANGVHVQYSFKIRYDITYCLDMW